MKRLIIVSCLVLITLHTYAADKGIISGKIVEQIGALPVPAAVVSLYITGTQQPLITVPTDENGLFKISSLKHGSYSLKVSYVGFSPLVINDIILTEKEYEKRLGTLKLVADQTSLNEITINAEKPLIQYAADMMTYNVESSIQSEGSTASDILKNVPMVEVDLDGNASISGKRNTRIFIDGKPSDYMTSNIADLLSVLPSDAIEKIEVMTNPPAKYSGDGEGIINIVMKKNFKIGLGGNAGASVGLEGNTSVNTNASYKSKTYSINGGASYRYNIRKNTNENYRENFFSDTTFYYNNFNDNRDSGDGGNYRVNFDWDITKKQNLHVSTNYNNNVNNNKSGAYNHYLDEDLIESSLRNQNTTGERTGHTFVFDADYDIQTDTTGGKLSAGITYNDNNNFNGRLQNTTYTPANRSSRLQENRNGITNNGLSFKLDYDRPVFKKRDHIELGLMYNFRNNNNDQLIQSFDFNTGQYVVNENLSNQFLYKEDIFAGYATYNLRGKNWGAKAGLRAELTKVDFDLSSGESYTIDPYVSLFPSFSINRNFRKRYNIGASYSVRVNRPRENSLNPQVNNTDPLNINYGNPNLLPELTHQMDISFNVYGKLWSFIPKLAYSTRKAVIERYRFVDQTGVSETTFDNVGSNTEYSLFLIGNYRPHKTISTNANFSFSQAAYKSDRNSALNRKGKNLRGRIGLSMELPFKTAFEGNVNYYNNISAQGRNKGSITTWMGARKVFLKNKLNARISISDPFGRSSNSSINEGINFRSENFYTSNTSNVTLSLNYRFTKVSKTKPIPPPATKP
ncbi:outer membrane beta-barrel family protein [Pedobacter frigoris]|uniref:TonB-dependent receptor n=1 Tax=Pedobacter frigoris TaxID=2571272 RepID=A0A4U1CJI9_9SPHI|nr:outer membrane beta-barrel family protein [Pedobacter frigoris]TKC07617.1 TonB-dependent receptor [Pedobacter frigoris]